MCVMAYVTNTICRWMGQRVQRVTEDVDYSFATCWSCVVLCYRFHHQQPGIQVHRASCAGHAECSRGLQHQDSADIRAQLRGGPDECAASTRRGEGNGGEIPRSVSRSGSGTHRYKDDQRRSQRSKIWVALPELPIEHILFIHISNVFFTNLNTEHQNISIRLIRLEMLFDQGNLEENREQCWRHHNNVYSKVDRIISSSSSTHTLITF